MGWGGLLIPRITGRRLGGWGGLGNGEAWGGRGLGAGREGQGQDREKEGADFPGGREEIKHL